eukprot:5113657-Lingulodinium_polyedra.AAC.1
MCWREFWEREIRGWLDATALRKRWLGSGLHERRLIRRTGSYNAAYHALKLLAGGAPSAAQRRGRGEHHCCACGSASVAVVWRPGTKGGQRQPAR